MSNNVTSVMIIIHNHATRVVRRVITSMLNQTYNRVGSEQVDVSL